MGHVTSLARSYSMLFTPYLIFIIISVFTLNRCYSYVGRIGRKQQLSLAGGCWRHVTVAHEIGELFFSFLGQLSKFFYSVTHYVLRHPLPSCEWSIRLYSNNFHSSRSFASCFTSFQLVQSRTFRSTSTVLLHVIFGLPRFFNQYFNVLQSDHE